MIRTRPRPPIPPRFAAKQAEWSNRWLDNHGNKSGTKWATPAALKLIRDHLRPMSYGKCFFCESTVDRSSRCEIEHHKPKSIHPGLAFLWTNLQLSCSYCNGAKSAKDMEEEGLRPDADEDPEKYLWLNFEGELEPLSSLDPRTRQQIQQTIDLYSLNRGELCEIRIQLRDRVNRWIEGARRRHPSDDLLKEELDALLHPSFEYKFVLRFALSQAQLGSFVEQDKIRFYAP